MSENKTLVRFNIQNAKYALLKSGGTYDTPIDLGTSTKIALQRDASVAVSPQSSTTRAKRERLRKTI